MRGTRRASVIMTSVMFAEALPLIWVALGRHGIAKLASLLGWGAPSIGAVAWVLAFAIALAYAELSMRSLPFIRVHLFDLHPLKLLAIPFALVTGTFEELFFRQWLMDWAQAHGAGQPIQIASSAVAFGIAHAIWGLFGHGWQAAMRAIAYTTLLGGAFAIDYLIAGRQLAPAAWSHILINLAIEPWLLLGVMNLRAAPRSRA